jgi:hypothetical protein
MTSTATTGIAMLSVVAIDCREPQAVAEFYSALCGAPVQRSDDDWVQLAAQGGVALAFQRAPGHVPPQWPGEVQPQQLHLDFDVPDLDAAEAQVLALGARKHEHQPGTNFRVYLDPTGHPFCLVLTSP